MHGVFARRVNSVGRRGDQSRHRAHVDNMTGPLLDHHWQCLPRRLNDAHYIDVKLRLDIFDRVEILEPVQPTKTCVVDQYVNATKLLNRFCN